MLDLVWKTWKFRRRMAQAARGPAGQAQASVDELDDLVQVQTAHWAGRRPLSGAAYHAALKALNARLTSVFILSVQGGRVRLWKKPAFSFPPGEEAVRRQQQRDYLGRAMLYQAFIQAVQRRRRSAEAFDFALDVNDLPEDAPDFPIFGFQKARGARNLLLPDVDFFHSKWYRGEEDALAYEDKTNTACFVGSSTGGWLTVDSIRNLETPRLRAAAHFHGNPQVVFQIAQATQCLSEEARAHLMAQPYFAPYTPWADQLRHRFLLVMDGNGATCSRLVKGLLSHSVVVKFDSEHELYYFPALRPGLDHLRVQQPAEVEQILAREAAHPGTFKDVAQAGRRFAAKYLGIGSVMDYTGRLLASFAGLERR